MRVESAAVVWQDYQQRDPELVMSCLSREESISNGANNTENFSISLSLI